MTLGAKGRACKGLPNKVPIELLTTAYTINCTFSPYSICGDIQKTPVNFLLDTGSPVSLLNGSVWEKIKSPGSVLHPWTGSALIGVGGQHLQIQGTAEVQVQVAGQPFPIRMLIVDNLSTEAILGLDFMEANQCSLAVGERLLHIPSCKYPIPVNGNCHNPPVANVVMEETRIIPPYSELEVMAIIPTICLGKPYVLESTPIKTAVIAVRALIESTGETIPVRLLNPCSTPSTVYKGTKIATLEEVSNINTSIAAVRTTDPSTKPPSSDLSAALRNIVSRSDTELNSMT